MWRRAWLRFLAAWRASAVLGARGERAVWYEEDAQHLAEFLASDTGTRFGTILKTQQAIAASAMGSCPLDRVIERRGAFLGTAETAVLIASLANVDAYRQRGDAKDHRPADTLDWMHSHEQAN